MAAKFHITTSGDVRPCNASVRPCRYGESDHFADRTAARGAVEERLAQELGTPSLKKEKASAPITPETPAKASVAPPAVAPKRPRPTSALEDAVYVSEASVPSNSRTNRLVIYTGYSGDYKGVVMNSQGDVLWSSSSDEFYSSPKNILEDTPTSLIEERSQMVDAYDEHMSDMDIMRATKTHTERKELLERQRRAQRAMDDLKARIASMELAAGSRVTAQFVALDDKKRLGSQWDTKRMEGHIFISNDDPALVNFRGDDGKVVPLFDRATGESFTNRLDRLTPTLPRQRR